jgi:hypothetical protein
MSKYYLPNGTEVKMGELVKHFAPNTKDGKLGTIYCVTLTEDTLDFLVQQGIITVKEDENNDKLAEELKEKVKTEFLTKVFENLANKLGWSKDKVASYINKLLSIYLKVGFDLILKACAVELDKHYPDHISKSPNIYAISSINGHIVEVDKNQVKNYRNFAAFRTIEDARFAREVLQPLLKDMYE